MMDFYIALSALLVVPGAFVLTPTQYFWRLVRNASVCAGLAAIALVAIAAYGWGLVSLTIAVGGTIPILQVCYARALRSWLFRDRDYLPQSMLYDMAARGVPIQDRLFNFMFYFLSLLVSVVVIGLGARSVTLGD